MISRYHQRGTVYIVVLSTALLLATVGFSALVLTRLQNRDTRDAVDWAESGFLALSAVEFAVAHMNATPEWRHSYVSGTEIADLEHSLGRGTMSVILVDDEDGDVADDPSDPVTVYGIGRVGEAVRVHQAMLQPVHGLEVLRTAVHAGTELRVNGGKELMLTGGSASSNGDVFNDGIIYGDVVTLTLSRAGIITGETTTVAPRDMPGTDVFERYVDLATPMTLSGNIDSRVISPGHNPWGSANADGVYFIDTAGNDLEIQGCRIHGTLVVNCPGRVLKLKDAVFLAPSRADYPALIVNGQLELELESEGMALSESDWETNFNPDGSPYQDEVDTDFADTYPNEIRGLVHALDEVRFKQLTRVRGVLLGQGRVNSDNSGHVIYDPDIYDNPPLGYTAPDSPMEVVPGSWRWVAMPEF